MTVIVTILAVIIAVAVILSTALFFVEVFIKRHHMSGQVIGLIFSAIAAILYFVVFCDRLPGSPEGPRKLTLLLPGVQESDTHFTSSVAVLVALTITYALRLGIYTRLFIIPALTLNDEEYNSPEEVEIRVNDLSAPVLAYLTFALVASALISGVYHLSAAAGVGICLALLLLYFGSSYLRNIRNSVIWLAVQTRILIRNFWILASRLVVRTILIIGKLESWRRRTQPGDEQFFAGLEDRLNRSARKARMKNEEERELLRTLASNTERLIHG